MRFDRIDAGLFVAALAIRIAYVLEVRAGPLLRYAFIDSRFYDDFGRRLAEGGGLPDGPFFMNVLYGFYLAAAHAVAPGDEAARVTALLVQAILGAATTLLMRRLGREIGREREGVLAGIGLAVFGPAVFYDGALLTPSLLSFLTTLGTLAAIRTFRAPRAGPAFGVGILGGLLVLGRANHALLLAAWAALALLRHRRAAAGPVAAMLLGAGLCLAPVTLYNFRQAGEWIPVTANGGMAMWAGNSPHATGIYTQLPFLSNPVPEREAEEYRVEASRRAGRELTLAQSGTYWTGETARRWLEEPGAMLRLSARKLRLWFHATESQTNLSYYFARDVTRTLAVFRVHLGWVLPLVIVGLLAEGGRRPWLLAPVIVSLLTCVTFYVSSEYRQPVVPILLLFAALGGRWLWERRHAPALARVGLVAGLLALLVAVNARDAFLARLQSMRVDYLNFGTMAADAGNLEEAETFLRRSIAIDPDWAPSRERLAEVLQRQGRVAEAAGQRLRESAGGPEIDPEFALAFERFQAGKYAEAERRFREFASRPGPLQAGALNNAGLCAMRSGNGATAESLFTAAREVDPAYASPVVHLGRLALARGDRAAAAHFAEEALLLAPEDDRARRLKARASGD